MHYAEGSDVLVHASRKIAVDLISTGQRCRVGLSLLSNQARKC